MLIQQPNSMSNSISINTAFLDSKLSVARAKSFQQKLSAQNTLFRHKLNPKNKSTLDKKHLMDVCYQLESLFIQNMMKGVRRSSVSKDVSFARKVWMDELDNKYVLNASRSGRFGLANQLYEHLSKLV